MKTARSDDVTTVLGNRNMFTVAELKNGPDDNQISPVLVAN